MKTRIFLALLDTMWGADGDAPHWFSINPHNHSGRRLYRLTGADEVWVSNACPRSVSRATQHGTPDPEWVYRSFRLIAERWRSAPLLVCGTVAQETYLASVGLYGKRNGKLGVHRGAVLYLPHPAARSWTRSTLDATSELLHTLS